MKKQFFKQLTLPARATLLAMAIQKSSASLIAKELGVSRQTIYRELDRNTTSYPAKNPPTVKFDCLLTSECFPNRSRKHWFCPNDCSRYQPRVCPKLATFPRICNGCSKIAHCNSSQRIYDAGHADSLASTRRSSSRDGIRVTRAQFEYIDNLVSPLIKQGQSVKVILANNPKIPVSKSTVNRWVGKGYMRAKKIDLRNAVRYKKNKTEARKPKIAASNYKQGHKYPDFLAYVDKHPTANVVEIDTVYGLQSDNKKILTIHLKQFHFQFGVLIEGNTSVNVNNAFSLLIDKLYAINGSHALFQSIFGVLLTDNGSEFASLIDIETDLKTGETLTKVFFCDPMNSQQKGACERNHEFIRYFSDKGVSIQSLTQTDLDLMFSHINSYARGSLNYKTPYQLVEFTYGKEFLDAISIVKVEPNDVVLRPTLIK